MDEARLVKAALQPLHFQGAVLTYMLCCLRPGLEISKRLLCLQHYFLELLSLPLRELWRHQVVTRRQPLDQAFSVLRSQEVN